MKVVNNSGVEFPATGGPGITRNYLLGIMLTGFAGAGFIMKRRRREAA